ncbi:hypothetical protein IV67_GL001263 [Weissella minor]|uniref:Extracellular matrix-binding protein ebh GA module domain-containing protein n=1 Tax=Weissella minor TaxID=1620 RepID=A0A0R2JKG5_9LACO|nr:hypothetical protein IV67_GL001263 [Weissella minor]
MNQQLEDGYSNTKVRYRMVKSGKQWLVLGTATMSAITGGLALGEIHAFADEAHAETVAVSAKSNQAQAESTVVLSKNDTVESDDVSGVNATENEKATSSKPAVTNTNEQAGSVEATANTTDEDFLNQAKVDVKLDIDGLTYLSDSEKEYFKSQVDAANSTDDVYNIRTQTIKLETQRENDVWERRVQTRGEIEALDYLSVGDIPDINRAIDAATSVEEINKIIEHAVALDSQNRIREAEQLKVAQQEGKEAVDAFVNLSDVDKQNLKQAIDSAEFAGDVYKLLREAEENDKRAFESAQDIGEVSLGELKKLSDTEIDGFLTRIWNTKTKAEVSLIVQEAIELNNQRLENDGQAPSDEAPSDEAPSDQTLDAIKQAAKQTLDKLSPLSKSELTGFKQRVDSATSPKAVYQVVEEATELSAQKLTNNNQDLEDMKDFGKQTTDTLPNLTDLQKNNLKKQFEAASSNDEIQHVLMLAEQLNAGDQQKINRVVNKQVSPTNSGQAELPNTGSDAQQNVGAAIGTAMLGTLALFGLGKRQNKREVN